GTGYFLPLACPTLLWSGCGNRRTMGEVRSDMLGRARGSLSLACLVALLCGGLSIARADSVAQVATSKFLADETLDALECRVDPIEGTGGDCNDCTSGDPEYCVMEGPPDAGTGTGTGPRSALREGD